MDDPRDYVYRLAIEADIPPHMIDGVMEYILRGHIPGSFLELIFLNDFAHAAQIADMHNRHALFQWATLLYHMPVKAWGSAEKMKAWHDAGGLIGLTKEGAHEHHT